MKNIVSILLLFSMTGFALFAQGDRPGFEKYLEKFKAEKIAFITDKLDLTVEEAQDFWPLYNKYQNSRDELLKSKRLENHGKGFRNLSSDELEAIADARVEQELKLAELKMKFHKDVKKVLPIEKVMRLYRAESEFMNYMLNKIGEQMPDRRRRDNNPGH